MGPFRVLTVDDHPIVLSGLRILFAGIAHLALCGEATGADDARRQAEQLQPDLIVTDLVLGGADSIALIEDLHAIVPAARIVVYSSHDEEVWARHALHAGARGYVHKAEPLDMVATALDTVLTGEIHASAAVRRLLLKDGSGTRATPHDVASLSARELQVLRLMGLGRSPLSMSVELGLSVKTVGTYRERLKTKLGFDTMRMLERFADDHAGGQRP